MAATLTFVVAVWSAPGQPCPASVQDSVSVVALAQGIIAADNNRDIDTVLQFYRDDAILHPPGSPAVTGITAIRPRYEALFQDYDPAIILSVDDVTLCGDLAVVSGRNGGVLHARQGAKDRAVSDVFVMVLRKADGEWRIARLMWHPYGTGP